RGRQDDLHARLRSNSSDADVSARGGSAGSIAYSAGQHINARTGHVGTTSASVVFSPGLGINWALAPHPHERVRKHAVVDAIGRDGDDLQLDFAGLIVIHRGASIFHDPGDQRPFVDHDVIRTETEIV